MTLKAAMNELVKQLVEQKSTIFFYALVVAAAFELSSHIKPADLP